MESKYTKFGLMKSGERFTNNSWRRGL